jgi:hypothetical protein
VLLAKTRDPTRASWKSLHASAVEDLLRRPGGGPLAQLVRAHG